MPCKSCGIVCRCNAEKCGENCPCDVYCGCPCQTGKKEDCCKK
uniref:Metallothionein 2 n=1 Tax=Musca domestica TaxID=7370 RepID=G3GJ65_MUSDO|nr:metallothionein 2 [Musca domestica]ALV82733.1 metallothionein-like protein [Musca domestica]